MWIVWVVPAGTVALGVGLGVGLGFGEGLGVGDLVAAGRTV